MAPAPGGKPHQQVGYDLNKAIHHIYIDRTRAHAFKGGDFSVLDGLPLKPEERKALETHDFPAMWAMHAHPVLLFHLAAVLYPREWYLQNVTPKIKGVPNVWYDYYTDPAQPA